MTINASDILSVTKSVTKKWTKQRKAEERNLTSRASRQYVYSSRVNFTEVADKIIPDAYLKASGYGKFSASKRQIFYACRDAFLQLTKRKLKYGYFANTLLVQYLNRHPNTAAWKVTADPRGTLTLPNAGYEVRVPCGTIQIDRHLQIVASATPALNIKAASIRTEWPSLTAGQRYQGVLYIEKEGFEPVLDEAKIAERFDLAILSCKGQSVVAARRFVDEVCRVDGGIPLFVVHDLDKAGFEISQRLTSVSDWAEENDRVTYRFKNEIRVFDLGLRLEDAEAYELGDEECDFSGHFAGDSIATEREKKFLRSGRRVELNAFTSPQFVEWLEAKLTAHGLHKRLIPDDDVLESAYRRAMAIARLNSLIERELEVATGVAEQATVPKTLRRQLQKAMKDSPKAWDSALYDLVKSKLYPAPEE